MKKTITLNVNGKPLHFDMTPEIYNKYINELTDEQRNSILAARDRFLQALRSDFYGGAVEDLFRPQPAPKAAAAVSIVGAASAAVVTDRRSVTPRAPFGNE